MATYHNFVNIATVSGSVVPQEVYQSGSHEPPQGPPISFVQYGTDGVLLEEAAQQIFCRGDKRSTGMEDGQAIADIRRSTAFITIRILWPGCMPYEKSINIEEHIDRQCRTVRKAVFAHRVAGVVSRFRKEYIRNVSFNSEWAPDRFEFKRYVLLELRNVSTGSYQPVILISAL